MFNIKPRNRKERIEFICSKKGYRALELFALLTDSEVKQYFDEIYPSLKDLPDGSAEVVVTCIRCNLEPIHNFECACGYNRTVFSEQEWDDDIKDNGYSNLSKLDNDFLERHKTSE